MLTVERVRELLSYDLDSGVFTWQVSKSNRAPVGSIAGTLNNGYTQIQIDKKLYGAHRLAWFYVYAVWPIGVIDHLDGDPSNNSFWNFRDVPQRINSRNNKLSKNNASGINGVSWSSDNRGWLASITIDFKQKNLGVYPTIEAATLARKHAETGHGFINRG